MAYPMHKAFRIDSDTGHQLASPEAYAFWEKVLATKGYKNREQVLEACLKSAIESLRTGEVQIRSANSKVRLLMNWRARWTPFFERLKSSMKGEKQ